MKPAAANRLREGNPLNSVFVRMALISLVVLFAVQAGWVAVLTIQRPHHDADGYARGLLLVLSAANNDAQQGMRLAPALNVQIVLASNLPAGVALSAPPRDKLTTLGTSAKAFVIPASPAVVAGAPMCVADAPSVPESVMYGASAYTEATVVTSFTVKNSLLAAPSTVLQLPSADMM